MARGVRRPTAAAGRPGAAPAPVTTSARGDSLKPVDAHLADVLGVVAPLSPLDLTLPDAHGCVLAEPVVSTFPLPPFDNSAMDGYAVRSVDLAAASSSAPVVLPVVGDIAAGSTGAYNVQPGLCVRIMTGAPMPAGADAVVPLEWTNGGIAQVTVDRPVQPGQHVRRAGEDLATGSPVLGPGAHLGATQIGLLAAVGRERVLARPRPRVVVLSTGSELVDPGQPLTAGKIPDSNSTLLTAAAGEAGGVGLPPGVVPCDPPGVVDPLGEPPIPPRPVVPPRGGRARGPRA